MENEREDIGEVVPESIMTALQEHGVQIKCLNEFKGDTAAHKVAIESALAFVNRNIRWLAFVGKTGTGKTLLTCAIIRELLIKYTPFNFIYTKHIRMIRRIRSTYQSSTTENEYEIINKFSKIKLLILDEVGLIDEISAWERATLDDILDYRYERKLPVILTSNLPAKKLFGMLGERIESRFIELGRIVNCTWGDYRRAK